MRQKSLPTLLVLPHLQRPWSRTLALARTDNAPSQLRRRIRSIHPPIPSISVARLSKGHAPQLTRRCTRADADRIRHMCPSLRLVPWEFGRHVHTSPSWHGDPVHACVHHSLGVSAVTLEAAYIVFHHVLSWRTIHPHTIVQAPRPYSSTLVATLSSHAASPHMPSSVFGGGTRASGALDTPSKCRADQLLRPAGLLCASSSS